MLDMIGRSRRRASPTAVRRRRQLRRPQFPGYGKLSGKSIDDLRAGERVAVHEGKDDPLDFVLWKAAKASEPDEPSGRARRPRPARLAHRVLGDGKALLGEHFDIHGGGKDLQFPHHENEIAQSEGANGRPFVHFWMHNGLLNVDGEKMSKSLGNFFTIRDVLKRYDGEVIRFFMLRTHYRSPFNFSDADSTTRERAAAPVHRARRDAGRRRAEVDWSDPRAAASAPR